MRPWSFGLVALVGCGFQAKLTGDAGSSDVPGSTDAKPVDGPLVTTLVDRGLVVRYFMDEADTGQAPANLIDSAPNPLALPITYGQATYTGTVGHRGLQWGASLGTGKVERTLGATKLIPALTSSNKVTIEVVVQITAAGASASESQITGLRGGNPDFMLTALGATDLRFFKPFGTEGATWANANTQQRMVLHLVFDTSQPAANDRVELFRNGIVFAKTTSSAPGQNMTVALGGSDAILIGNRQGQDRSVAGTIFYVAYYNAALTTTEIASNAARLLANDDP